MSRGSVVVTTSLLLTFASSAHAEDVTAKAAAQSMFERGRQLVREGRFEEACPSFAKSQELDPGAGTLLNLANCNLVNDHPTFISNE